MGGNNKEHSRTNRMIDQENRRIGQDYGGYIDRREQLANDVRGRSNNDYNDIYGRITGMLDDPDAFGAGNYRRFAQTGGLDDENIRRIRGNGGFDEFARTGGISEGQKGLIRANAAATGRGIYDSTSRQLDTGYSAQGGINPGYNAQSAKLIRDSARAANESALAAELGIEDRVSEGRRWGIGGMSQAELGLGDLLQRGKMFGAEGMRNDAAARASLIDSLRGLRSDTPGELAMYEQLIAGGMGGQTNATGSLLGTRAAANPQQAPWWQTAIGAAAPIGAGFLTGGAYTPRRNTGYTGGSYSLGS
jgi:hypothetical protein